VNKDYFPSDGYMSLYNTHYISIRFLSLIKID